VWALRRAVLGPEATDGLNSCTCAKGVGRETAASLPSDIQEELLRAGGGDSPRLYEVLADDRYDAAVFVGYDRVSTHFGLAAVPERCRTVVWPAARHSPEVHLPIHDSTFARPDAVVVFTGTERAVVEGRGADGVAPVVLPFALRVNTLALETEPHAYDRRERYVIVAADWRSAELRPELREWARSIERQFVKEKLRLRLVGPGALRLHPDGGLPLTESRTDVWRWMSRAVAVLDPEPGRLLGREALEAMLFATPVVVHASSGASREHAENGNAGVWFRTFDELATCVAALFEEDVNARLAEQAMMYAKERLGDSPAFVASVAAAVLEERERRVLGKPVGSD
jgi:glycosyltransferase involved in cell wall biosynthesis